MGLAKMDFFPKFQLFLYNLLFENRYFIFENMYYVLWLTIYLHFLPWWSRCILKIFYSFVKRKEFHLFATGYADPDSRMKIRELNSLHYAIATTSKW